MIPLSARCDDRSCSTMVGRELSMTGHTAASDVFLRVSRVARRSIFCVIVAVFGACAAGCASHGQSSFASPQEASDALVSALRAHDDARLKQIFGPAGKEIINSGDSVQDEYRRSEFLAKYDVRHALIDNPDGSATLQVGDDDWPFPVPIIREKDKWVFDTESGKDEILNRRIGRNELATIQVCLAVVDAQREYAMLDVDGDGLHVYAQKFLSDPGKKNGLYWPTEPSEPPSPMGPLVAEAAGQGYTKARTSSGEPQPYHGYYYRLLTAQGEHATGGAADYMVNGKLIGGFGVVAYPATYGNSGIMTFVVNHTGIVYQRDLGEDTQRLAESMTVFDPDESWKKVE